MEPSRFDELTKALATSTSRRQALKTIAATTIGSILGLAGIGTAFAKPKCHRAGLGCDTDSNCCPGLYCANNEKCTACPALPACNSGCPCPQGQTCSNGTCVVTPVYFFLCVCNDSSEEVAGCFDLLACEGSNSSCTDFCASHEGVTSFTCSLCT